MALRPNLFVTVYTNTLYFTDILGDSEWDKHSHKKVVVVFKVKSPASELCFELCCCHKVVLSREAAVV